MYLEDAPSVGDSGSSYIVKTPPHLPPHLAIPVHHTYLKHAPSCGFILYLMHAPSFLFSFLSFSELQDFLLVPMWFLLIPV